MIAKYLMASYKDGARGEISTCGRELHDCWSMARSARTELYGRELLPSRGGEHQRDPRGFTKEYQAQANEMAELKAPVPGAVAAVLKRKRICTHVALVTHDINKTGLGLHILDINPGRGARLIPLFRFAEEHALRTIKYYDDKSLSQRA